MGFGSDFALGKEWENKLLDYIQYDTVSFAPPRCKGWDVETTCENHTVKWEVKSDRMACRTGNVAIEFRYKGNPSGITSTEADYYAYFILRPAEDPTLYLIPTENLKTMIESPTYRRIRGGDGFKSEMILIPLDDLYPFIF
jgi:hypothetical protein